MRSYLYVWHDPHSQSLVASGLEFKDFLPSLNNRSGIALIEHRSGVAQVDVQSGFSYLKNSELPSIFAEDIYSWGNFAWADYEATELPSLNDESVAELLFFAHKARPLKGIAIPGLKNRFLAYSHDDGWYLRLYYSQWSDIEQLLATAVPASLGPLDLPALEKGGTAFWLSGGTALTEECTHDVDVVLNRHE